MKGFGLRITRALTDFVDMVIPELQRRGLFRTDYEGRTLRDHLRMPTPVSRWQRVAMVAERIAVAA
jgi:hypothetical protein